MANSVEVVICRCRGSVTNELDMERLAKLMEKNKRISRVHVMDNLCTDGADRLAEMLGNSKDTGLVLAACASTPFVRQLESNFKQLNIPRQACEIVPIRDWVLWAHPGPRATEAANDYIRLATARVKAAKDIGNWAVECAVINRLGCDKCKRCLEECPVKAYSLDPDGYPLIDTEICQRCGICVGSCPKQVISLPNMRLEEVSAALRVIKGDGSGEPTVAAFCCEPFTYPALQLKTAQGMKLPGSLRVIKVPCMGAVNMTLINDTLSAGVDGVLLLGCQDGPCRMRRGNELASRRLDNLRETLERMMMDTERVKYVGWPEGLNKNVSVDPNRCNGCQICAQVCPFEAVITKQTQTAVGFKTTTERSKKACRSCGICAASCPSGACQPDGSTDRQILAEIDAVCWGSAIPAAGMPAVICDCGGSLNNKIDLDALVADLKQKGYDRVLRAGHLCSADCWQEVSLQFGQGLPVRKGVVGACAAAYFATRMGLYQKQAGMEMLPWVFADLWQIVFLAQGSKEKATQDCLREMLTSAAKVNAEGFGGNVGNRDGYGIADFLAEHMEVLKALGPNPFKE